MKNEQTRQWAYWLRHTAFDQVQSRMYEPGEVYTPAAMCCLGVGAYASGVCTDLDVLATQTLPDGAFFRWLGFDPTLPWDHVTATDVDVDWQFTEYPPPSSYDNIRITYSWLNDETLLTFPQIADMIDYFGVSIPKDKLFGYKNPELGIVRRQQHTMAEIVSMESVATSV